MFRSRLRQSLIGRRTSDRCLYHVLAIESSCDDSSVCLIDRPSRTEPPRLIDHKTVSLDSSHSGGIIPLDAVAHHLQSIPPLVNSILRENNIEKVDLVCATRGPGMFSSLSSGFNLAKGLAMAWNVPIIGVHHMLGHLLTPRFFSPQSEPQFPFVSLLASGGHTMLVLSTGLFQHTVLADTIDVAIGNALDKCARQLGLKGSMLGKELEKFVVANDDSGPHNVSKSFTFPTPLSNRCGRKDVAAFSFASFVSTMTRMSESLYNSQPLAELSYNDRKEIATRAQSSIFQHVASKCQLALSQAVAQNQINVNDEGLRFVCSGGVASNQVLRNMLKGSLSEFNPTFYFPDPQWCTDNALMIGWAGIELYESGQWSTRLDELPIAKWPLADLEPTRK